MAAFSYKFKNNIDYNNSVQNHLLQIPPATAIIKMDDGCYMVEPLLPNNNNNNIIFNTNNNINAACGPAADQSSNFHQQLLATNNNNPSSVYVGGCFQASDHLISSNHEASLAYYKTCCCTDDDDYSSSVTVNKQLQISTGAGQGEGEGEEQQQQQFTAKTTRISKEELFSVDSSPSQEKMYGKGKKRSNINNNGHGVMKKVEEEEEKKKKKKSKTTEEKKLVEETAGGGIGYIHVRARRGQATDNHSLAERVRREKISERMKLLQALVPGCDKVSGKALMLDEIINYVQSLQYQVEFLSMKLASLNPALFYDFGGLDLDSFITTPHQTLCSLEASLQNMHQMQAVPAMVYHDDTLQNIADNCGQLQEVDSSPFHLHFLPQNNNNNINPQQAKGQGQVLWDVDDDQRYILGNQQQQQPQQEEGLNNLSSLQYYNNIE